VGLAGHGTARAVLETGSSGANPRPPSAASRDLAGDLLHRAVDLQPRRIHRDLRLEYSGSRDLSSARSSSWACGLAAPGRTSPCLSTRCQWSSGVACSHTVRQRFCSSLNGPRIGDDAAARRDHRGVGLGEEPGQHLAGEPAVVRLAVELEEWLRAGGPAFLSTNASSSTKGQAQPVWRAPARWLLLPAPRRPPTPPPAGRSAHAGPRRAARPRRSPGTRHVLQRATEMFPSPPSRSAKKRCETPLFCASSRRLNSRSWRRRRTAAPTEDSKTWCSRLINLAI